MCDISCFTINDKYLLFHGIEPKLRRRARIYAGGDSYAAREILAGAADLFVSRYRDISGGEGGVVALAQLCLVEAARNLRPRGEGREINVVPPPTTPPLPEAWQIWERIPRHEQVGVLGEVIRRVLSGHDLADAGAAVGWSAVQTSRELARLGQRITGDRPARYTSRRPVRLPLPDAA